MIKDKAIRARIKRAWKGAALAGRNLPLTLTSLGVLTCVELFTAGGIVQTTTAEVDLFGLRVALATLEIGLSYGAGILAILGSGVVAELRADPRPAFRRQAGAARAVSTLLLVVPVIFFTNALAVQTQRAAREGYLASELYQIDHATALGQCLELLPGQDCYIDSMARREAQAELSRADEVKTARIDGAWFACLLAAIFVYGTLGWANTALHKPRPETPWEAKERAKELARARKRQRETQKLAEQRASERALRRGGNVLGNVLAFGKRA